MSIQAVVFDLDGVIIDTEEVWNDVRHDFAVSRGGHWSRETDQPKVMGANSIQWAASMRENNGVDLPAEEIYDGIVAELKERYARHLPIIPGAPQAVARLAEIYRLGVASSSPLELIEYSLELAGMRRRFEAVVSSDEVATGKPAPDVYQEACRRLGSTPEGTVAVEDSTNGIFAAHAAGLAVVAIPNAGFAPSAEALALADVILGSIGELTPERVASLQKARGDSTPAREVDGGRR